MRSKREGRRRKEEGRAEEEEGREEQGGGGGGGGERRGWRRREGGRRRAKIASLIPKFVIFDDLRAVCRIVRPVSSVQLETFTTNRSEYAGTVTTHILDYESQD